MPVVTALRHVARARVAVELDGTAWRVLPLEAVAASGLDAGVPLDRARARRLGRELRRLRAREAALRALRGHDHTAATLRDRLAARGVPRGSRDETVETLQRVGLVDDERFAHGRARLLAERGAGDLRIRDDLERRGVAPGTVTDALAGLEPERERVRRAVEREGLTPRLVRRLAANGFGEDVLADLVADLS